MVSAVDREPTVSVQVLRALVLAVEDVGVARSALLAGEDLPDLDALDARLTQTAGDRVWTRAVALTNDPALGLHWFERISHRTFGPVSHLTSYAANLREAFSAVERFGSIFSDAPFFALRESEDVATLEVSGLDGRPTDVQRLTAEMCLSGYLFIIRAMWNAAPILDVSVGYPAPAYRDEYTRLLGLTPRFDQPFTGVTIARALLDEPSRHRDPQMIAALTGLAETRLVQASVAPAYSARVRELLAPIAPRRLTMQEAARALGLSVRTLRRRLQEERRPYQEIEYEALAGFALHLLRERGHSIKEVAHRMGFLDAGAFHRAFKRWTGTTPNKLRAQDAAVGVSD